MNNLRRILIVDLEPELADVIQTLLSDGGCLITIVASSSEALEQAPLHDTIIVGYSRSYNEAVDALILGGYSSKVIMFPDGSLTLSPQHKALAIIEMPNVIELATKVLVA